MHKRNEVNFDALERERKLEENKVLILWYNFKLTLQQRQLEESCNSLKTQAHSATDQSKYCEIFFMFQSK